MDNGQCLGCGAYPPDEHARHCSRVTPRPDGERVGDWVQTFTGVAFWPLDPRPDEVHIVDVAHQLAMVCRFGGAQGVSARLVYTDPAEAWEALVARDVLPPDAVACAARAFACGCDGYGRTRDAIAARCACAVWRVVPVADTARYCVPMAQRIRAGEIPREAATNALCAALWHLWALGVAVDAVGDEAVTLVLARVATSREGASGGEAQG